MRNLDPKPFEEEPPTTVESLDSRATQLLEDWKRRCRQSQRNHAISADTLRKRNGWIVIAAILFSAAAGTVVLVSMQQPMRNAWRTGAGIAGIVAAILTALLVSLNYSERAERHRSAAARFASVQHEMELLLAIGAGFDEELRRTLDRIRHRMDWLAEIAPTLGMELREERRDAYADK